MILQRLQKTSSLAQGIAYARHQDRDAKDIDPMASAGKTIKDFGAAGAGLGALGGAAVGIPLGTEEGNHRTRRGLREYLTRSGRRTFARRLLRNQILGGAAGAGLGLAGGALAGGAVGGLAGILPGADAAIGSAHAQHHAHRREAGEDIPSGKLRNLGLQVLTGSILGGGVGGLAAPITGSIGHAIGEATPKKSKTSSVLRRGRPGILEEFVR